MENQRPSVKSTIPEVYSPYFHVIRSVSKTWLIADESYGHQSI
jgi:hypothetical protein